jgi:dephospho-CoA kinase
MASDKLVVGIAGMPGAGKSLVVRVARADGYEPVVMGDVIREEAQRRNLEPNPENIGKIMLDLRATEGKSVVARRCISKIEDATRHRVVVDGIRSLDEVEELRKHFHRFSLLAVCASPETRFRRLYRRARSDDAENWAVFQERDARELSVGLGNAIAMAEYTLVNDEAYNVVRNRIKHTLRRIEREWKE